MTPFDVAAYTRDPLDLRQVGGDVPRGLGSDVLDAVVYLWSVERAALDRVRDVLVTPTHADARVTAFLITWTFEQHALAERLAGVLAANGRGAVPPPDTRSGRVRRVWDERAAPTVGAVHSNLLGADVTSGHMVTGWLDAAATRLVHRRVAAVEPRLAELSALVDVLKARHLEFFAAQLATRLGAVHPAATRRATAQARWAGSAAGARRHGRRAAVRWRWPGTRYTDGGAVAGVAQHLLAGPGGHGEVRALDGALAALPGLTGARPIERALTHLLGGHRR